MHVYAEPVVLFKCYCLRRDDMVQSGMLALGSTEMLPIVQQMAAQITPELQRSLLLRGIVCLFTANQT